MKGRTSNLSLVGFRGATRPFELAIDPTKPLVVIFGENGTGKSTLVDAIDFVTNGGMGALADRQATPAKDYLPALGAAPGTLAVELTIGSDKWRASLSGAKPLLAAAAKPRPLAHILRRAQIFDLLAAKPAARYDMLSRFIAVPGVELSEEALRTAMKDTKREFEDRTAETAGAKRQLQEAWEGQGQPGAGPMEWARDLAGHDAGALVKDASAATALIEGAARTAVEVGRVTDAATALARASAEVGQASKRLESAERESSSAEAALMELLEAAETYVDAHPELAACPVCEQPVQREALVAGLARRRTAGLAVDEARAALRSASQLKAAAKVTLGNAQASLWKVGANLLTAAKSSHLKAIKSLGAEGGQYSTLAAQPSADHLETAACEGMALLKALDPLIPTLSVVRDQATADAARLKLVKGLVKAVDENSLAAKEAEQLLARITKAVAIVEARRKAFVDGVLAGISSRVCDLYSKIHPGEEIGDIKLAMDPSAKKRASLELTGRFNEVCDVPPEGYYSESHLDTLGICVFLALAERSRAEDRPNLLVLDDVLTSVDGPHLDRFVALVHDEAELFSQAILTTHYRHWFETYRRGQGPAGQACLIELSNWSIGSGIRADRSALPTEELAAALAKTPLDRLGVASRAGVILETLLTHLTLCFRLRLSANKRREHTLGELASAVPKKLRAVLSAEHDSGQEAPVTVGLAAILDPVESLVPFRNWVGAHSNVLGDEVPNSQVEALGQAAVSLAGAITCRTCGEMVGKRAGTHWRCRCGRARLTPLAAEGDDPPSEDVIP